MRPTAAAGEGGAAAGRLAVSWADVERLAAELVRACQRVDPPFDVVLGIARGGLVPAALVAARLGVREVLSAALASYDGDVRAARLTTLAFPPRAALRARRVLIVDDVWDSGRTAVAVRERVRRAGGHPTVAVLHHKPGASHYPDDGPELAAETTAAWLVYPWERFAEEG